MSPGRRLTVLAILLAAAIATGPRAAADSLATAPDSARRGSEPAAAISGTGASLTDGMAARGVADTGLAARVPEDEPAFEDSAATPRAVPVLLGGKEIFVVRAARGGRSPAVRATAIRARLDAAVIDVATPADSVSLSKTAEGIEVRLGRHYLWLITPGDIEGMSVRDLATMVDDLPARLQRGIERERSGRTPMGLLISALIALGITLIAFVLMKLVLAGGRRWRGFLERWLPTVLRGIRIGTFDVLSQAQLTGVVGGIIGRADLVALLFLLYFYLTAIFSLFPWSQGWGLQLFGFARQELVAALFAIGRAIPRVAILAAIFAVFWWLTQLSDRFFTAIDAGTVKVDWVHPELAKPTKRLVGILLWITAIAIAYPYIPGSQSKAVQGMSILIGVMVSLGSSGVVSNVIAGLVLTYSRSFSIGDRVRIGDLTGDVVNLGFFATKLRTPRNEEITMPNGQLASQPIVNYTRLASGAGLVLHTQVTIGYDADWRQVHALLIEAAGRIEGIEREPAPWVLQRSLNDYHISYEICGVTRRSHDQILLYSRLHEEIQDAFARAGVEILSPAYHALRDANAAVLPNEPQGPRPAPGGFRVRPPGGS